MPCSTGRTDTGVLRHLDGERRSLVVMCPWGQAPAVTLERISDPLTSEELVEVRAAFGLDQPQPPSWPVTNSGP